MKACPQCCSEKTVVDDGKGPHAAALRCVCGRFIKWLGAADGFKSESTIQGEILVALSGKAWLRIWRNNTGVGRALTGGQVIQFGLKGSADLLGILNDGRFLSIEVKRPSGRVAKEQKSWGDMVTKMRGLHVVARSAEDAINALAVAGYGHE